MARGAEPHCGEQAGYVVENARRKVEDVAARVGADLIIGSDTVVVLDGRILEKPKARRSHAASQPRRR